MKINLLLVGLCLAAASGALAQDHSGKPFDYEGTLQQLRQTAFKGAADKSGSDRLADKPDSDQLYALFQIASIYEIRYKSGKEKNIGAYMDSSLHYVQLLISGSQRAGQLDYEAAADFLWGQNLMALEEDYKLIIQKFLAAASLTDAYLRVHPSPSEILTDMRSNAYSYIGHVYFLNKEYDNALIYCNKAIQHAYPAYNQALPQIYKGRIYMAEKNYPLAEAALHQAITLLEQRPLNLRWEAMDYLSELLIEKGQPDSAIALLRQAIAGDKRAYHLDMHYYWMGRAYLALGPAEMGQRPGMNRRSGNGQRSGLDQPSQMGQRSGPAARPAMRPPDSVLAYGRLELEIGERLSKSQDRLWGYELLYKAYERRADRPAELIYYRQWVMLSDSLGAIEQGKGIAEIQHKYDFQRVQAEADHRQFLQDQALQRRTRIFLFTFLGLLSLTAALLAFYLVKMRRKNSELKRKNKEILDAHFKGQHFERKRIASELHDNLSSLLAATKLTIQVLDPSALSPGEQKIYHSVLDMMDTACNEVRYISHNMMPVNIEKQGLSAALESLIAKLNQTGIIGFELTNFDPRLALDKMISFNIYSICLELCNNILRHSKATRAAIICKAYEKELHLLITDNGKGIPDTKKDGMGIKNVHERIHSLNGTLEVRSSTEGTSFWFTIPLEQKTLA